MMRTDFDVLIVGGGLVGASLACALCETSLTVGMVEAAPPVAPGPPSYDDRTLALAYGSRRILEAMGIWDAVAGHAVSLKQIHISDRGRFGVTRLKAQDAGLEALGYVVTHRTLGAALYERLAARSNVTVIAPASVQSVVIEEPTARVRVVADNAEHLLTARLVVAADGADSPVRAALGIRAQRLEYGQTAIVTAVTAERGCNATAYERFTDSGPLALLPADAQRYAVVWTVAAERAATVLGWDDATFRRELQDCFGERLGRFVRVGKRYAFPLALAQVREHVRARVAIIGNAAHTVHPVAGQGFNLGLRDVATLAQVVTEAMAEGRDPGDAETLHRYAQWRLADNRTIATFTHSLVRVFSNDYLPVALGRNLGLLAVDLFPPIKRRLIRMTSGLDGRLPRLACGLPLERS